MLTVGTTRFLRIHEARHGDAGARERPGDHRHARRARYAGSRLAAWFGSGLVCGAAGLLLADLFTSLDYTALTFLVISSLAAALIGRLRSLWVTLAGGLAVGLVQAVLTPVRVDLARYRTAAPFVLAIVALLWLSRRRVVTISRTAR